MGITKTGAVSLKAVREDLDLSGAGSMSERAVKDKVQKKGSVSLSDFRGNILGIQYDTKNTSEASWNKLRYQTAGTGYLMNNPRISTDGVKVYVPCTSTPGRDVGVECRVTGRVLESGTYKLKGSSIGEFDTNYLNGEMHVSVVANAAGYLVGVNDVVLHRYMDFNQAMGQRSWSYNVPLSTSKSYITFVLRNVHKGSGGRGTTTTHQFWDWTLGM